MAVKYVDTNAPVKLDDCRSNTFRDIRAASFVLDDDERQPRPPTDPVVIGQNALWPAIRHFANKKPTTKIQPKAVVGGIFGCFFELR